MTPTRGGAVGAGARIRTEKGLRPETYQVSAFASFATPAPLLRSTYPGSREATNGRPATPPNRGGSMVGAVVRVTTERMPDEAEACRWVAGPSQELPKLGEWNRVSPTEGRGLDPKESEAA